MTDRSPVQQAVYDELVDVMAARDDTPDATDEAQRHVVLDETDLPETPPAIAISWSESPDYRGIWDVKADPIRNDDDEVVDVVYTIPTMLDVDVTCIARTDETAVSVYDDLVAFTEGFALARDPSSVHSAVTDIQGRDVSPTAEDERRVHIYRIGVHYEKELLYSEATGEQLTPVREVDIDIDGESYSTT
jgi:hypothetical protein